MFAISFTDFTVPLIKNIHASKYIFDNSLKMTQATAPRKSEADDRQNWKKVSIHSSSHLVSSWNISKRTIILDVWMEFTWNLIIDATPPIVN